MKHIAPLCDCSGPGSCVGTSPRFKCRSDNGIPYKQPRAAEQGQAQDEVGWLIEHGKLTNDGYTRWLWHCGGLDFQWTTDNSEALRFCRRSDAEQVAHIFENEDIKITEHKWCAPRSTKQPTQPPAGDVVERMLIAYHGCKPHPDSKLEQHMTAALEVARDGMVSRDSMKDLLDERDAEWRKKTAGMVSLEDVGKQSIALIAAERERQIKGEGWALDHNDAYKYGELAAAASCYAHHANCQIRKFQPSYVAGRPSDWPWGAEWWKPSAYPARNLVKAGALIVAELDRLNRLAKPAEQHWEGRDALKAEAAQEGMVSLEDVEKEINVFQDMIGWQEGESRNKLISDIAARVRNRLAKPVEQTDLERVQEITDTYVFPRIESKRCAEKIVAALRDGKEGK